MSFFVGLSAIATPQKFSVIEFNTWGVPLFSTQKWRYEEAMRQIEEFSPDFVFLEEVFSHKGKKELQSELYPEVVSGPRALPKLVGSGLRILSKFPVIRSEKMAFGVCVKDDCLSRKGAALAVVVLPDGSNLNLIATHLNARGDDDTRIEQLMELKVFIEENAELEAPILLGGDFNFNPESKSYSYMMEILKLQDTWPATHTSKDPGITYDCKNNKIAHDYSIKTHFPLTEERIDYMLSHGLTALSSKIVLDQKPELSDHYGIEAEFEVTEK